MTAPFVDLAVHHRPKGASDRVAYGFTKLLRFAVRIRPRLDSDPDDFRAICGLSRCLVHLGRLDEAYELLERVRDHSDPMNYHLACTFARAGETQRALDTLELVVEQGWNHRAWLDRDPDFDGLRGDRRFIRIAESIAAQ